MWVNVCAMHVSFPADSTDVVMLMLLVSHPIQQRISNVKIVVQSICFLYSQTL